MVNIAPKWREMEWKKDIWGAHRCLLFGRLGALEQTPVCPVPLCGAALSIITVFLGALRLLDHVR